MDLYKFMIVYYEYEYLPAQKADTGHKKPAASLPPESVPSDDLSNHSSYVESELITRVAIGAAACAPKPPFFTQTTNA